MGSTLLEFDKMLAIYNDLIDFSFSVFQGAFFVAVFVHHACSVENMFAAKLLMHLFFACMMAQVRVLN